MNIILWQYAQLLVLMNKNPFRRTSAHNASTYNLNKYILLYLALLKQQQQKISLIAQN